MTRTRTLFRLAAGTALVLGLVGCSNDTSNPPAAEKKAPAEPPKPGGLSAEDQALSDAQGYCVISGEPLGSMGPPVKLDVKGQPVFICCKGCKAKAEEDPAKTLARAEELKTKVKTEKATKTGS